LVVSTLRAAGEERGSRLLEILADPVEGVGEALKRIW
jgi:hypothetical protein